jgi:hypothetical protein
MQRPLLQDGPLLKLMTMKLLRVTFMFVPSLYVCLWLHLTFNSSRHRVFAHALLHLGPTNQNLQLCRSVGLDQD